MIRLPQTTRPLIKALAVAVFAVTMVSCASTQETDRQKGYGELAECIKPGMYRRQLYAVLPPMEKPVATPVAVAAYSIWTYPFEKETHRLDPEHFLEVTYYVRNPLGRTSSKPKRSSKVPSPDTIDGFIEDAFGPPSKPGPSKESPDDVIASISPVQFKRQPLPPAPISKRPPSLPR
ncbi:hypothetical protein [Verrucomicrobium sp. BvORR106]|uniref:hypothetical protein n=1 Tax=Verrucomicrobium sp. BvORR106 TaxID=1403819 RepID=UPI00056E5304|nr:hypothetical protein [Verrucomicrobium sp. BvORR106]